MLRKCRYCSKLVHCKLFSKAFLKPICDNHIRFLRWKNKTKSGKRLMTNSKLIIQSLLNSNIPDYDYDNKIEKQIEKFLGLTDAFFRLEILNNNFKPTYVRLIDYKNQYLMYKDIINNNILKVFVCDISSIELLENKKWFEQEGYKVVEVRGNKYFTLHGDVELTIGTEYDVKNINKDEKIKVSFYEYDFYESDYPTDDTPFRFFKRPEDAISFYQISHFPTTELKLFRIKAKKSTTIGNSNSNMWTAQKITLIAEVEI